MTLVLICSPVVSIKDGENTTVKTQPPMQRKLLQFSVYYFMQFPLKLGLLPALSLSLSQGDSKQKHCGPLCHPSWALLQPLGKLSSDSWGPSNQIHTHLQPNSALTLCSCLSGYHKAYSRSAGCHACSAWLTYIDIFPPMCAAVNL